MQYYDVLHDTRDARGYGGIIRTTMLPSLESGRGSRFARGLPAAYGLLPDTTGYYTVVQNTMQYYDVLRDTKRY